MEELLSIQRASRIEKESSVQKENKRPVSTSDTVRQPEINPHTRLCKLSPTGSVTYYFALVPIEARLFH